MLGNNKGVLGIIVDAGRSRMSDLTGAIQSQSLSSISFFGKKTLQSPTKPVRGNDPREETNNQQLQPWLAHALLHRSHSSFHSASPA